jgi:hypothetical protein
MPYRRWWCLLNPPNNFLDHEAEIQRFASAREVGPAVVRYGLGPSAELELKSDDDAAVVEFLEDLRTNLKVTALDPVCDLTAEQRDGISRGIAPPTDFPPPEEPSAAA